MSFRTSDNELGQSLRIRTNKMRLFNTLKIAIYIYLVLYMLVDTYAQNNAIKIKIKCDKLVVTTSKKNKNKIQFIKKKYILKTNNMSPEILSSVTAPITAGINAISQNQTNKANRRLTIDMFNMTNAYNTPLQQVERMKSAGLNPALMYNGAPVNTAQQPHAPEIKAYQIPENLMADIAQKLASAKLADSTAQLNQSLIPVKASNIQAATENLNQQTEFSRVMAGKTASENARIQQDYSMNQRLFDTNVQYRNEQLKNLQTDTLRAKQELQFLPKEQQAKLELLKNQALETLRKTQSIENAIWQFNNTKELQELNINPNGGLIDTVAKYIMGTLIGAKKQLDKTELAVPLTPHLPTIKN